VTRACLQPAPPHSPSASSRATTVESPRSSIRSSAEGAQGRSNQALLCLLALDGENSGRVCQLVEKCEGVITD
jgi:hypothetical protein